MANVMSMAVLILCLAIALPAHGRDTKHLLPIAAAMETKDAQDKLDGSVKFYFGDQAPPQVITVLGSDVSNRKTNAFGKSDENACHWAFLSAMVALQPRAQQVGATRSLTSSAITTESDVARHRVRMPCTGDHRWCCAESNFVKIADG